VLLDARPSNFGVQFLNICCDRDGLDVLEAEAVVLASVEEAFYRARVSYPGIAVADGRGKEFDELAAGALALCCDRRRSISSPARTSAGRRYHSIA
jgi:hypothetical protein